MKTLTSRVVSTAEGQKYYCKMCSSYKNEHDFHPSSIKTGRRKCRYCMNSELKRRRDDDKVYRLYINLYNALRTRKLYEVASRLERQDILQIIQAKELQTDKLDRIRVLPPTRIEDSEKLECYRVIQT